MTIWTRRRSTTPCPDLVELLDVAGLEWADAIAFLLLPRPVIEGPEEGPRSLRRHMMDF